MNKKEKILRWIVIPLIFALVSMLVLSKVASSPDSYKTTIASLDHKKDTVMKLSAAAAATSTAITLLPDDTMTPIATKMADLSSSLLIILSVIYLEKYLLPVIGYLIFGVLVPITCVVFGLGHFMNIQKLKMIMCRLIIVSLAILFAIPLSEATSGIIERTYESSIQDTVNIASQDVEIKEDEDGGIIAVFSKIKDGVTKTVEKFENVLSDFIEAIAVMIVTSCLIPLIVLVSVLSFVKFIIRKTVEW